MASYLITGGCGFIGSHLGDALIESGHKVRVLDNLSTGKRSNLNAKADLQVGDIGDVDLLARMMQGVQGCFHLAAVASVELSNRDWPGTHRINQTGSVHVFDAARHAGRGGKPVSVVYASSAAIYGDNASVPLSELDAPHPLTAYGADKLGSELHAGVAAQVHHVPTTGLRFFNVYGPRQDPSSPYSGVISIFCDCLQKKRDITIFGDGEQVRDFVYVQDVVRHLMAAMRHTRSGAQIFNVCTGRSVSIRQMAQQLFSIYGYSVPLSHQLERTGDIRTSIGNPERAVMQLQVRADVTIGEGLYATVASMQAPTSKRNKVHRRSLSWAAAAA